GVDAESSRTTDPGGNTGQKQNHRRPGREGKTGNKRRSWRVGKLRGAAGEKSAAGCGAGAGDRGERPSRNDLWHIRSVGVDRRFTLVLVGRRAGPQTEIGCPSRRPEEARPAGGEISRHFPERRRLGPAAMGGQNLRAGGREHRTEDVCEDLRVAAAV